MIAAEAPTKAQNDSDLRTLALEDLMRENDALSTVFDVEAFDILRRTPADLTLGGLTGGQSRVQRIVSAVATRNHRETCEPNVCAWMDGASSSDEDGAETAPGASAWVQARPVGPTSILHDTHFKIATRLRLMVPLCAHETRCAAARLWNHWLTTPSCVVGRRCHGGTTSLLRLGKPFAEMLVSQPTSNKKSCRVPAW